MSVSTTQMCSVAPLPDLLPRGPNRYGFVPTFRFYGCATVYGDGTGGSIQAGFTLPYGGTYNGTLWTLDMVQLLINGDAGANRYGHIEVRGGELMSPLPLDWWGPLTTIYESATQSVLYRAETRIPEFPFRLEGQNSYVRLQINYNGGLNYDCAVGGFLYLPLPASAKA